MDRNQTYLGNIAYRQVMEATSEYESFIVETAMYQWIDCTQQIDWLIHQCMKCCNKRPWNAMFKMVETQALTLVWKYLNVSRCLYFSNKISVDDKIVTKMAFILNVLSSSSALVFCRKRYKNRRTENFRIFFFFNLSRKRNPILRIIRNQNPIISQYFASTTR